jgi:hypothetical protein
MSSPITVESFCNRAHRCAYYKEIESYVKSSRLIFVNALKLYGRDKSKSFLDIFSKEFSSRSYTGLRQVYKSDIKDFKDYCVKCAINISNFLNTINPSNIMDVAIYKHKIKAEVGGICQDKKLNIFFSFKNSLDTSKTLDIHCLSNYICNIVNQTNNNCLIMSVPTDSYFKINYEERDYTMQRGYISSIVKRKQRKPGDYCTTCKNTCKPLFLNGLERVTSLL